MKNFNTLEVGKTYINGYNSEVTIVLYDAGDNLYSYKGNNDHWYTADGHYYASKQKSKEDLTNLVKQKETHTMKLINKSKDYKSIVDIKINDRINLESGYTALITHINYNTGIITGLLVSNGNIMPKVLQWDIYGLARDSATNLKLHEETYSETKAVEFASREEILIWLLQHPNKEIQMSHDVVLKYDPAFPVTTAFKLNNVLLQHAYSDLVEPITGKYTINTTYNIRNWENTLLPKTPVKCLVDDRIYGFIASPFASTVVSCHGIYCTSKSVTWKYAIPKTLV